ncbi:MAG TPA: histidine phosphatase family protein [Candidatus Angelobacter sp.]|nr:histidine phosphatase family protein [Candidatus Angelobacter sp.]
MGTLILVRHSITEASAAGRNLGQRRDPALTPAGLELAERLGSTLALELGELPHDVIRIVASPARRCRQTAEAIAPAVGLTAEAIEVLDGLLEIDYGAWDGLTADECRARDPEHRAEWEADPWVTACPEGESGRDVAARAFRALGPLEAWLTDDRARVAVAVAHNHVLRLRLCDLFGWPMREYRDRLVTDPAGYSLIGFGPDAPIIRRVNAAPA